MVHPKKFIRSENELMENPRYKDRRDKVKERRELREQDELRRTGYPKEVEPIPPEISGGYMFPKGPEGGYPLPGRKAAVDEKRKRKKRGKRWKYGRGK